MNNSSLQSEILNLEKQYWNAMAKNDAEAAVSLTRFPCVVASPKGSMRVTEEQYRQMMKANNPDLYKGIEIQNPHFELINDDTVQLTYSTKINGMKMADVSTWVHEGDKWLCAFHSEKRLAN